MSKLAFAAASAAMLITTGSAWAVLVAGSSSTYTSQPAGLPQWNSVGQTGSGGGVYLGNGWVITAAHVGMGEIGLGGVLYQPNPSTFHQLTEPDGSGNLTDLIVYQVIGTPNVPAVNLVTQTPNVGASLTMVGFGQYAVGSPVYYSVQQSTDGSGNPVWTWTQDSAFHAGDLSGYTYVSGAAKRWGTATVSTFSFQGAQYNLLGDANVYGNVYDTMFPTIYSGGVGVAQAIGGDSGGAVFDANGNLAGIMEAMSTLPNQPANTVIADSSTSVDLDYNVSLNQASYITDIASYQPQIEAIISTPVPEPTGLAVLAVAGAVVSRRRRA